MSESNRYYVVDITDISRALRGGSAKFNQKLSGDFQPETEVITAKMFNGEHVAWDEAPLRGERWEVFAELSMLVGMACQIEGREVGWDAWRGQERLLAPMWNWHPLDATFARRFLCRPIPPFYFSRRHLLPPSDHTPYLESYPHGFFLRDEIPSLLPSLLLLIASHYKVLTEQETSPVDQHTVGQDIDLDTRRDLLLAHADDERMVWQFNRAIPLYNALCAAHEKNQDLFSVGY